jgi:flagellin
MNVVNTNTNAVATQKAMVINQRDLTSAMQQLSTGKRINGAADDAAGLAISNKLGSRIISLDMAVRNANDGISLLQTADGAAGVLSDMLFRMRELAVQAGNDTNSTTDRTALQTEVASLQSQIGNTLNNTEWNGMKVLKGQAGNSGSVAFHVGPTSTDSISLSMASLDTGSLANAQSTGSVDVSTRAGATSALTTIDSALTEIDQARSLWGATSNRLMHAADNATNVSMNSSISRSRVLDTDYAQATAELARSMILDQAGAAMLSQANQQPMYVLALLR